MWEHVWTRFNIFALLFLLVLMMASHAIMMHFNRPPDMIHWLETMIAGVVAALISELRGSAKGGS